MTLSKDGVKVNLLDTRRYLYLYVTAFCVTAAGALAFVVLFLVQDIQRATDPALAGQIDSNVLVVAGVFFALCVLVILCACVFFLNEGSALPHGLRRAGNRNGTLTPWSMPWRPRHPPAFRVKKVVAEEDAADGVAYGRKKAVAAHDAYEEEEDEEGGDDDYGSRPLPPAPLGGAAAVTASSSLAWPAQASLDEVDSEAIPMMAAKVGCHLCVRDIA